MNKVIEEDVCSFASNFELANELNDSTFLITGATGLVGSTLIRCLVALNKRIRIYAPVRNLQKAEEMYSGHVVGVRFIECDLTKYDYNQIGDVDYIVHCAAPTASKLFVDNPVETIDTIFSVTKLLLDYAKNYDIKSFVYLSSLEVYGIVLNDNRPVTEDMQGFLDPLNVRSSYPMAKRAAENLCVAYFKEYHVPIKIARLTQTTGAGITKNDNRVIVQFARLAAEGEDIVLYTTGEAARPYCYTTDAITALLYILLKGQVGEAYNVANEGTYISVYDMAELIKNILNPSINVRIELNDNMGYAPVTKLRLSSEKLSRLGWTPKYGLKEIIERLSQSFTL